MPECNGAPIGLYYDVAWHGVASREGFTDAGCRGADFGNARYNDHHYHFSHSAGGSTWLHGNFSDLLP